MFETLETRRLFAVLVGTELRVFGTAGNDILRVRQQDPATLRVEENGVVSFFNDASVNSIRMNVSPFALTTGSAGSDTVQIVSTAALPVTESGQLFGGAGNDSVTGGHGNDVLRGDADTDFLRGGVGNDNLDAGTGNNVLLGEDGNDVMTASTGNDSFNGGLGIDTVSYSTRTASLNIKIDNVANDGQLVSIFPLTFEKDNVQTSVENVVGGSGNDTITAQVGLINNLFIGGAGNDRLDGGDGNDTLDGVDGNDIVLGRNGNDTVRGGNGNDTVSGAAGNDFMFGGAGNDVMTGGLGSDSIRGEAGDDMVFAQDGVIDAFLDGGAGFDLLDRDGADPAGISFELVV